MSQEKIQSFLRELPKMREDLPFSPEVLKQLFVQTGNNSMASLEDVGETLSKDQGLTTRILSLANSAYYGLQARCSPFPGPRQCSAWRKFVILCLPSVSTG